MAKSIEVNISDNQRKNTDDEMVMGNFQPKGRVRIFERKIGDNKLYLVRDTSNLIVYRGRNWLLQRAFNQDLTNREGWKDKYISWFGVGSGGAVGGSPLTPAAPELQNCQLGTHGTIDDGANYVAVDGKEYHTFNSTYPRFINDPDVTNGDLCTDCTSIDPDDAQTYNCDKFLIGMVKTTIATNEANGGTGDEDYQDINEAGLFISESNSLTYPSFGAGSIELFARVCFSTIRKNSNRELLFTWLIYF